MLFSLITRQARQTEPAWRPGHRSNKKKKIIFKHDFSDYLFIYLSVSV